MGEWRDDGEVINAVDAYSVNKPLEQQIKHAGERCLPSFVAQMSGGRGMRMDNKEQELVLIYPNPSMSKVQNESLNNITSPLESIRKCLRQKAR